MGVNGPFGRHTHQSQTLIIGIHTDICFRLYPLHFHGKTLWFPVAFPLNPSQKIHKNPAVLQLSGHDDGVAEAQRGAAADSSLHALFPDHVARRGPGRLGEWG